jgi:hypothetical protein
MDVVHVPVMIIINAVPGHFLRIRPDIIFQILVVDINPRINHGHNHVIRSHGSVPRLFRVDLSQVPLLTIERIIGNPRVGN